MNFGMKLEFIDIKRTYIQAPARRDIYVQRPEEESSPGMCAKLVKAMHGTRDAAQNWEWAYRSAHEGWGFIVGKSSTYVIYHIERGIILVVQGDDFTELGIDENLNWYRSKIMTRSEAKSEGKDWPG